MSYQIVKYSPEFKKHVAKLRKFLSSPNTNLNVHYLEWKYEHNPYIDTPLIYLALCDGELVGMRGFYGAKWQTGEPRQAFLGPCGGDLVITPEHRNRGVFAKIMETALADLATTDYKYLFSLSAGLATYLGSLMTGWRSVGTLETGLWRSKEKRQPGLEPRLINRLAGRLFQQRSHPFSLLDRSATSGQQKAKTNVSIERLPRPEAMAELTERIGADGRIRHVKDRQYFEWRFRNPLSVYRFLFWGDSTLEGYLVLRVSAYPHRWTEGVSIVDWEAVNLEVLREMLRASVELGGFEELTIWSATMSQGAKSVLQDTGFTFSALKKSLGHAYRSKDEHPAVLIRPVHKEMLKSANWALGDRQLLKLSDWDLRMIYSDSF